jgi:type I restriction enzyme S subunit
LKAGRTDVALGDLMVTRPGTLDPSRFTGETFELFSIPAHDRDAPDVVTGAEIGSAKQLVLPGDVLLSRIVPHIRRARVVRSATGRRLLASGEWIVFRSSLFDPEYLKHLLVSDRFHSQFMFTVAGVGGSLLRARPAFVARLRIRLPPLDEQRRIAQILDRASAVRRAGWQAASLVANELRDAQFYRHFGDLRTNERHWPLRRLGEVASFVAGASLPGGVPYLGQTDGYFLMKVSDMNLPGNEVRIGRCAGWRPTPGAAAATCPPRSIVIPKRGGAIGTNKKRITLRPTVLDPNLMAIYPDESAVELDFMYRWFIGFDLAEITSGSSVPQLNKRDLAPLEFPVPPLDLQRRFSSFTAAADELAEKYRKRARYLDALFASLRHRAFGRRLN